MNGEYARMVRSHVKLPQVEHYEPYIGAEAVDRICKKADRLRGLRVEHINSTYYGGGVAELLSSLTLLMNTAGLHCGWRVLQGRPDFFSVTKKMHNALQGAEINLSDQKKAIYEEVVYQNAVRMHLDHDIVVVHDPQPLPIIRHYRKKAPWIWRCHVDLSAPNRELWAYLKSYIDEYDAVVLSLEEYAQAITPPQLFFMPAIDPFSIKNRALSDEEIEERFSHYGIPTDLPLVVQISRFDRWKDPQGVIDAFRIASREVPCRLVLVGNVATDDPEGQTIFTEVSRQADDRIIVLSCQDSAFVNALQTRAAVVLQKSIREGFGLTVTEAMWKGVPVIGGDTGGIRRQITDGVNGFLVDSVTAAAARIVQVLKDRDLRERIGRNAHHTVEQRFLLTRLLEQDLDLFSAFEVPFRLRSTPQKLSMPVSLDGRLPPATGRTYTS